MILKKPYSGVSLVEVLVALLVLGISVIGFIALQLRAVETSNSTYSRSQAMSIARDIIERVKANPQAWPAGYVTTWTAEEGAAANTCHGANVECTSNEMANYDVARVKALAQNMLFNPKIAVDDSCGESAIPCVVIAWDETSIENCDPTAVVNRNQLENSHCLIVEFWPEEVPS